MPKKTSDAKVERRLFALYPEQMEKLRKLARAANMKMSAYLRETIDMKWIEANQEEPVRRIIYGVED